MAHKLANQVLFWSLLGPFFATVNLLLFVFKPSHETLPFAILLCMGIPLCWKGGYKGFALLLTSLTASVIYFYPILPIEERFSYVGGALSTALTLLIMTCGFAEAIFLATSNEKEVKTHLKNALDLDEKMQKMRKEMKAERSAWNDQLRWQQELADTARKDFLKLNKQKEQLDAELSKLRSKKRPADQI